MVYPAPSKIRRPRGRPSKRTAARIDRICDLLSQGVSRAGAAGAVGISRSTLAAWLAQGRADDEAAGADDPVELESARALYRAVLSAEAALQERACETLCDLLGSHNPARVRQRAAQFILSRRFPEDWGPCSRVVVVDPNGGPVEVVVPMRVRGRHRVVVVTAGGTRLDNPER